MRTFGLVLILAAIFSSACISQNTSSPSNASRTQTPTAVPAEDDHTAERAVERISIPDARAAVERSDAVFVDVRQTNVYASGHIAGALSLPEAEIPVRGSSLPKGKKIIAYCS